MIQDTSLKTYKEITNEGLLGKMESRVLSLIVLYPNNCDRIYAEIGHLKINQVTGRRNELMRMGCVEDAGIQLDPDTNRSVHIWRVPEVIHFAPKPMPKNPQKSLTRFLR